MVKWIHKHSCIQTIYIQACPDEEMWLGGPSPCCLQKSKTLGSSVEILFPAILLTNPQKEVWLHDSTVCV